MKPEPTTLSSPRNHPQADDPAESVSLQGDASSHMMRSISRVAGRLTLALAIGGLGAWACSPATDSEGEATSRADRVSRSVVVAPVESVAEHREVRLSGVTRAETRGSLAFEVGGRMVERSVDLGDRVRIGSPIARLDAKPLGYQVAAARAGLAEFDARLAQADRDAVRARDLVAKGAATTEELEQAEATLLALTGSRDAAQARLAESQRNQSESRLRATFAGVVSEVWVEPGEVIAAGQPIVEISGDGAVEVEVELPEALIAEVAVGEAIVVELPMVTGEDGTGRRLRGTVTSISPGRGAGRLFPVRVRLENGRGVQSGLTAEVVLDAPARGRMAVPLSAVIDPVGERPTVFRVTSNQTAERLDVSVVGLAGDRALLGRVGEAGGAREGGGLAIGDRVIVAGQSGLGDGESVVAVDQASPPSQPSQASPPSQTSQALETQP